MPEPLEVIVPEPAPLPPEVAPRPVPWEGLAYERPRADWSRTLRNMADGLHLLALPDGQGRIENPENLLVEHEHLPAGINGETGIRTLSRMTLPDGRTLASSHYTTPTDAGYRRPTPLLEGIEQEARRGLIDALQRTILQEMAVPNLIIGTNAGTNIYYTNTMNTTATTVYQQYALNTWAATEATTAFTQTIRWPNNNFVATADNATNAFVGLRDILAGITVGNGAWARPAPPLDAATLQRQERKRRLAAGRARKLLRDALEADQRAQLADLGYFEVVSETGRVYRIYQGISMNVVALDDQGREALRLCAHPAMAAPAEDHMLMQKLVLETDEKAFLRVANQQAIWTPGGATAQVPADLRAAITAARARQGAALAA